ncbi:CoA transferase [Amycolatopsis sp.]|uniref:CoA transferase n=1 Tax=Amycolatopsis sp. TaxID=37632 RepID=UPI002C690855|nr:CoA transferase [Amycolatopsis sp.]HVV11245.1 CoA transferase [Amycolatopsis sp.]
MGAMVDGTLTIEVGGSRAAAFAAKLMADAGGEVVTVEDERRRDGMTAAARLYLDAGKDVVTRQDGSDAIIVQELLPYASVFVTDLSLGELRARGLDWETLHALAPRMCYVRLPAVGWSDDEAGELAMQALSGLMYMVGRPDAEPLSLPYGIGSLQLGLHGAAAAAAALNAAAETGEGHLVEISGTEVLASYVRIYGAVASYYRIPLRREGRRAPGSGGRFPFGLFPCKDGYVAMICRSAREWDSLLEMMGHPEWSRQERYQDLYAVAITYPGEVDELISPWLMSHTRDELLELAQRYAVPVAPVRRIDEVLEDQQLSRYRDFFDHLTTKDGRVLRIPGRPWASESRVFAEQNTRVTQALSRNPIS